MIRKLCRLALAASFLGLTSFAGGTGAMFQDDGISVDVKNSNQFPIRVKRAGVADNDVASVDMDALEGATFPVTSQGDQVFMAWTLDGHYIGSNVVTVATLTGPNHAILGVGARGMFAQLQPRGAARNNGGRPGQPPNNGNAGEVFAPNLGIFYRQVPYDNGTFGAQLTRPPAPGSPASTLQLEPGDTIVSLDDLPFRVAEDVLRHYDQTSMVFVNIRTGLPQAANLILPSQ